MKPIIDEKEFFDLLRAEFPEIREEVEAEEGLIHLQMMEFIVFTKNAIRAGDWALVKKCMSFADKVFCAGTPVVRNAISVSYLEELPREGEVRDRLWAIMTPELRKGWDDVLAYLSALLSEPKNDEPDEA
jgi:hypothetical protein